MLFIVSSNVEKVDPVTRKLIRSHVMQGRKQTRIRPKDRSVRKPREIAAIELLDVIKKSVPLLPGRIGSDLSFFADFQDEVEPQVLVNMIKCR